MAVAVAVEGVAVGLSPLGPHRVHPAMPSRGSVMLSLSHLISTSVETLLGIKLVQLRRHPHGTHTYVCMHTYILTYIHACIHTCIHIYIYTCIHIYIYTCIHIYIYTCIHTYIQTYIHIYIADMQTLNTHLYLVSL